MSRDVSNLSRGLKMFFKVLLNFLVLKFNFLKIIFWKLLKLLNIYVNRLPNFCYVIIHKKLVTDFQFRFFINKLSITLYKTIHYFWLYLLSIYLLSYIVLRNEGIIYEGKINLTYFVFWAFTIKLWFQSQPIYGFSFFPYLVQVQLLNVMLLAEILKTLFC